MHYSSAVWIFFKVETDAVVLLVTKQLTDIDVQYLQGFYGVLHETLVSKEVVRRELHGARFLGENRQNTECLSKCVFAVKVDGLKPCSVLTLSHCVLTSQAMSSNQSNNQSVHPPTHLYTWMDWWVTSTVRARRFSTDSYIMGAGVQTRSEQPAPTVLSTDQFIFRLLSPPPPPPHLPLPKKK